MKRIVLVIVTFFVLTASLNAAHIIGGEMRYTYVGPGIAPNSTIYHITLILFRGDDPAGAPFAGAYVVGIYNNDNGIKVPGIGANNNWVVNQDNPPGILDVPIVLPACIQGAPVLNYTYASYSMDVELPNNLNGYTIAYQTCCRINGMVNVGNSTGSTYNCIIPGSNQLPTGHDSSPQFAVPVNVICKNAPFTLNFAATDPDPGDSLSYSLCNAYNGGGAINAGFNDPAPPPYGTVNYNFPYSSANPFGTSATINPLTGIISGTAPDLGKYVVCVCIDVFRNGVLIGSHRKDLIVQVSDCEITSANPIPDFVTCGDSTIQFSHSSTGAFTVFWDFGVLPLTNDTSNLSSPTFTYIDTGLYDVKFVINRGTSCSDSVVRKVGVYPGFFPGFEVVGGCYQNPFLFRDTTFTRYGFVNTWKWDFGDLTTLADTSHLQTPLWTFAGPGPKTAQLIVTNSKGCNGTATVDFVVLDKPPLTVGFPDTLICIPDAVTLNAVGTGAFTWTPLTNIINANTSSPTVNPLVDTWYYVDLDDNGCKNKDSVHVRVVSGVTLTGMPDTTICLTDNVQLTANTNGLTFLWTATSGTLSNPNILNPVGTPTAASTTYLLRASIGSCFSFVPVVVNTVPYPVADAGPPQVICYNTSAQLNASHDGNAFSWSPTNYLSDPKILNPIATPPRTTSYVLTVFDNAGCPKPGRDTIVVTVQPKVLAYAGRDTTVVVGQPLLFNGSGGVSYLWSPAANLNNPNIRNPVGVYYDVDTIRYKMVVRDAAGCPDSAFVTVNVFKTIPYIFVPTAFTPNNDGLNDVVRPIAVGIQRINYFSIYNRWGQLVFTTTANKHGWDGTVAGRLQNNGVFVWMVSAVDYQGKAVFLKGTVALIR
ncbi:MAG: PKD domain-containing protein [Chitinophagaceae bacterium]